MEKKEGDLELFFISSAIIIADKINNQGKLFYSCKSKTNLITF